MKKYKILGNHDYGEYVPWKTEHEKQANLQRLIKLQRDIGFDLLLDKGGEIGSDFIRCIDNIYRSKGGGYGRYAIRCEADSLCAT
ncbi:MAG: hypothetical protein KAV45_11535 [Calditrichia bacterium]|nr:hypothetical protein [Calditrichia bacterium]